MFFLFWAKSIHSSPFHIYYLKYNVILLSHLQFGLPRRHISSCVPHHNSVCNSPLPHMYYMPCPSNSSRSPEKYLGTSNRSWSLWLCSLCFSTLISRSLGSKYSYLPRYPVSDHTRPMSLPECEWQHLILNVFRALDIQGVSWLVDITAGSDFLGLCEQKRSYKHMSDFGRLRIYGHFLIPVHALVWTASYLTSWRVMYSTWWLIVCGSCN